MDLRAEATRAARIADAFSQFREPVAHEVDEITTTIAELNTLSNALRRTDELLAASDRRSFNLIQDDLKLVVSSVLFTFNDIWAIIGRIGDGVPNPSPSAYRQTWKEISYHCRTQGKQSLAFRLDIYRRFLLELCAILGSRRLPSQRRIEYLRVDIRELLDTQDRRLITSADAAAGLSLAPIVPLLRPRSYERDRPPSSPTNSRDGYPPEQFMPPQQFIPPQQFMPPQVPEVPTSPTGTFSTASWSGSSAATDTAHWAREVFKDAPSTMFPSNPDLEVSHCIGRAMKHAKEDLNRKYEELFKITFEGGLSVRLYHRERDHGAKILCETPEKSGHKWYSCLPLHALDVHRNEQTLYLCQPHSSSEALAWAILHFSTIERLVLFYSTLLSMRSHDGGRPFKNIRDHELKGEDCFFSGEIRDDGYVHALRVYHDRHSKAVRLLASVASGDMKHTPVWTAFVTHSIHSPTWLRRAGARVICLKELRRHVFSPRYEPQIATTGEHVLEFTTEEDATDFNQIIEQLAFNSRPIPMPLGPL